MNKVNTLTNFLKDLAVKYGLEFESDCSYYSNELKVRYERFDYQTRSKKGRRFTFTKQAWDDINHTIDVVEKELIEHFNLKKVNSSSLQEIKKVIFNDPATIVFWEDGTKTVVKAQDEEFDPEKGLAMAISKKALGNQGSYYNVFKKWVREEAE